MLTLKNQAFLFSGGNDCRINVWKFPASTMSNDQATNQHQQIKMASKVNCMKPYLDNNEAFLLACDQSQEINIFKFQEGR